MYADGSYSGNYSSVIRTDEFLNTIWYSSFQISNDTLNTISLLIDDEKDEVFLSTLNTNNVGWFIALNYSSGIHKRLQCYQFLPILSFSFGSVLIFTKPIYSFSRDYFIITGSDESTYSYEIILSKWRVTNLI